MTQMAKILSIPIHPLTEKEVLNRIENFIVSKIPHQIVTVNPEFLIESLSNKEFKQALLSAELALADGIGIRAAATYQSYRLPAWQPLKMIWGLVVGLWVGLLVLFNRRTLSNPIPETITGTDLVDKIAKTATQNNWKIYLLGGKNDVAQKAADILKTKYPNLLIVGAEEGMILNPDDSSQDHNLITKINRANPDILFVAFGAPKQDLFIYRHKQDLNVPVMMGVGGAFDFIAGRVKRAPSVIRSLGLEWLWRLIIEPWRFKRILTATIRFPWKIFLKQIS